MAAGLVGGEHPLVVGHTLLRRSQPSSQLYSFRYDFQPASVQKATSGVLVLDKDSKVLLAPHTSPGEQEGYYEGNLEASRTDPDNLDCIAIFDGQQWTLEVLSGTIKSRHKRGRPNSFVSSAPEQPGTFAPQAAGRAAPQPGALPSPRPAHWASEGQQPAPLSPYAYAPAAARTPGAEEPSSPEEGEVDSEGGQGLGDGDLDAALNEALFTGGAEGAATPMAVEEDGSAGEEGQQEEGGPSYSVQQPAAPVASANGHSREQQQQQQQQQHGQQQHQQQHLEAEDEGGEEDQSELQADEEEEDHDSVWQQFGAAAMAAPSVSQPAAAVVGDDDEDSDDEALNECSDDQSDGLGVEVF